MSVIYEKLNQIFADTFVDDTIRVGPETTASDIEGWDSHKQIEILLAVEETFGVKFRMQDVQDLQSVGQLVALIKDKLPLT